MLLAGRALAYELIQFKDQAGKAIAFTRLYMHTDTEGYAVIPNDDKTQFTIFKTTDGARTWEQASLLQVHTYLPVNNYDVLLYPQVWLVRASHWDETTGATDGVLLASWDNGQSWIDLTTPIRSQVKTTEPLGVLAIAATQEGFWVRVFNKQLGMNKWLYALERAKYWWVVDSSLNDPVGVATRANFLAGYGYDRTPRSSRPRSVGFYYDDEKRGMITQKNAGGTDIIDPTSAKTDWGNDVIMIVDNSSANATPQRAAALSCDGGKSYATVYNSDTDKPDFWKFHDILCGLAEDCLGIWRQSEGDDNNRALWVRQGSGKYWSQILLNWEAGDYEYYLQRTFKSGTWVFQYKDDQGAGEALMTGAYYLGYI